MRPSIPALSLVLSLSLLAACLAANPAFAGESGDDDSFYLQAGASFYVLDLPDYEPIALRLGNAIVKRLSTEDGQLNGPLASFTAGWAKPDAFGPGYGLVVEGSFFHASMSNTETMLFNTPAGYRIGWYPIDGNQVGAGTPDPVATTTDRDVTQYGGELLAGIDMDLGDGLSLMPFAGYSYMHIEQDFQAHVHRTTNPATFTDLDETISGDYNGLVGGARLTYTGKQFEADLRAGLAAHYVDVSYDGDQYSSVGPYRVTRSVSSERGSIQGRIEGGAAYLLGAWKLGATAGFEANSYVPMIISSDKGTAGVTVYGKPSHIGGDQSTAWKLGLNLSCDF